MILRLRQNLRRPILFGIICFLGVILSTSQIIAETTQNASTPWLVMQCQNEVSAWLPQKALPKTMDVGTALDLQQSLLIGSESFCVIGNTAGQRILLASLSSALWDASQPELAITLQKGSLRFTSSENAGKLMSAKVPYGIVATHKGSFNLFLKADQSALLDLFEGEAEVRQGEQTKVLLAPKLVVIDEHGLRELTDPLLPRRRAIFDFREKPSDWADTEKAQVVKKNEAEKLLKGEGEDKKQRHKARNAKLVAGQADGEGEYHWDFSLPIIVYIIPLALILLISLIAWRSKHRNKAPNQTDRKKAKKDSGYESADIVVWRGNLTANDPPLETTKTTHILGNVEDGAKILAHHELRVMGCFQGGNLVSNSNVTIESGINGQGKAHLDIAGSLHTAYISEAQVVCRDKIVVEKAIRNAQVVSDGDIIVQGKNILGGWVASATCVITPGLGSDFCETKIILGQPATPLWKELIKKEPLWSSKGEFNKKASLRVMDELVSALIEHGTAKLDQKKAIPGPVETRLDPTDLNKLQVRGFRKDEEAINPTPPPQN